MWAVGDCIRQGEVHGTVTAVVGNTFYYWLENGTCGGCLSHRLEKGYRMARPRKDAATKKAEAVAKVSNTLLDAVKFCAPGFDAAGEAYAVHALIYQGWITTYNGIIMFGHPIDTPMQAAPHYGLLLAALKATNSEAVQITQLDGSRLSVKQRGFRTVVPCMSDMTLVSRTAPDPAQWPLDSRMREAFETIKQIANKRGETVMQSAVLIRSGEAIATDNQILATYWHGIAFPTLAVPADFIEAVLKIPKSLVSFGYTEDRSLTFYFDDGSFVRTQLYAEKYADVDRAMPKDWDGLAEVPPTFAEALTKIEPFMKKERSFVYAHDGCFSTDEVLDVGTVIDCAGLKDAPSGLDVDRLLKVADKITHIDYTSRERTRFVGENFRGVLCNFILGHRDVKPDDRPALPSPSHDYGSDVTQSAADTFNHPEEHAPYLGTDPMGGAFASVMAEGFSPPETDEPPEIVEQEPTHVVPADGWQ